MFFVHHQQQQSFLLCWLQSLNCIWKSSNMASNKHAKNSVIKLKFTQLHYVTEENWCQVEQERVQVESLVNNTRYLNAACFVVTISMFHFLSLRAVKMSIYLENKMRSCQKDVTTIQKYCCFDCS